MFNLENEDPINKKPFNIVLDNVSEKKMRPTLFKNVNWFYL